MLKILSKKHRYHGLIIALMWGIPNILLASYTMHCRATIDIKGTVIKSKEGKYSSGPSRFFTVYTIQPADGGKNIRYTAEGNDPSLAKHLPVGTKIWKERG